MLPPTYLRVARWDGQTVPDYEKRWCEIRADGTVLLSKRRGVNAPPPRSPDASATPSRDGRNSQSILLDSSAMEDILDLSYANDVLVSSKGNIAGNKFEIQMLDVTFLFKADSRQIAEQWVPALRQWRDYVSYKLFVKAQETASRLRLGSSGAAVDTPAPDPANTKRDKKTRAKMSRDLPGGSGGGRPSTSKI